MELELEKIKAEKVLSHIHTVYIRNQGKRNKLLDKISTIQSAIHIGMNLMKIRLLEKKKKY